VAAWSADRFAEVLFFDFFADVGSGRPFCLGSFVTTMSYQDASGQTRSHAAVTRRVATGRG
jgi:hypothetical protein